MSLYLFHELLNISLQHDGDITQTHSPEHLLLLTETHHPAIWPAEISKNRKMGHTLVSDNFLNSFLTCCGILPTLFGGKGPHLR